MTIPTRDLETLRVVIEVDAKGIQDMEAVVAQSVKTMEESLAGFAAKAADILAPVTATLTVAMTAAVETVERLSATAFGRITTMVGTVREQIGSLTLPASFTPLVAPVAQTPHLSVGANAFDPLVVNLTAASQEVARLLREMLYRVDYFAQAVITLISPIAPAFERVFLAANQIAVVSLDTTTLAFITLVDEVEASLPVLARIGAVISASVGRAITAIEGVISGSLFRITGLVDAARTQIESLSAPVAVSIQVPSGTFANLIASAGTTVAEVSAAMDLIVEVSRQADATIRSLFVGVFSNLTVSADFAVTEVDAAIGLVVPLCEQADLTIRNLFLGVFGNLDASANIASIEVDAAMGRIVQVCTTAQATLQPLFAGVFSALAGSTQQVVLDFSVLERVTTVLTSSLRSLRNMLRTLPITFTALANSLSTITSGMIATLGSLIAQISSVNIVPGLGIYFARIGAGLGRLVYGFSTLAGLNTTAVITNGNVLMKWVQQWAALGPAVANLTAVGRALSIFSRVATIGGGNLPPVSLNLGGSANIAMDAASNSSKTLSSGLQSVTKGAKESAGSFNTLNLALGAFVGYSLSAFAKFDDALTRTMAHQRDWAQQSRGILQEAITKVSTSSITGPTDLTKGLDVLLSSGMNPAMSAQALATAETFAVASHMEMVDATQKLVEIQRSLGLSSNDVETHMKNMIQLSDAFVGIAPMVGSSVKQFTESFGERFIVAAKNAELSLQDMIVMMGVYSLRGIKGSEASDRAARALQQMSIQSIENIVHWRQLGVEVFDVSGNMLPLVNIIENLSNKLDGLSVKSRVATLRIAGFEQRAIAAILPFVGMQNAMKELNKAFDEVGGVAAYSAEMIRRSFLSQMKILWNNIVDVAIVIGSHLAPAISVMVRGIESLTGWFLAQHRAVQGLVLSLVALAFAGRAALGLLGGLAIRTAGIVVAPILAIGNAVFSVAQMTVQSIVGVAQAGWSAISIVWSLSKTLLSGAWQLFWIPLQAARSLIGGIASLVQTVLVGSLTLVANALLGIVPLLINIGLWIGTIAIGLPVIAGVAITLGLGIASLLKLAVAGAVSLWAAIREGAAGAVVYIAETTNDIAHSTIDMWSRMKEGAADHFTAVVSFFQKVAGFFWNFAENVAKIWDFIGKNWRDVAADIGNATAILIENITKNIITLGEVIFTSAASAWKLVWGVVSDFAAEAFSGIKAQWKNILGDMGTVFKTFLLNLASNIGVVFSQLNKIAALQFVHRSFEAIDADIEAVRKLHKGDAATIANRTLPLIREKWQRTDAEKDIRDSLKFKDPLEGLDTSKLTSFSDMIEGIAIRFGWAAERSQKMFEVFKGGTKGNWTKAFEGLVSLLDSFRPKAGWASLLESLNTVLPPDAFDRISKMIHNFAPYKGEGDEAGPMFGKQSPGYQFKQISTERTMLGGPVSETLDYQQLVVMQMIQKDVARMAAANTRPENRTTVNVKSGWGALIGE